ncbi:MAG: hypothetical protein NC217_07995 [Muribaculaceae bacterium]|nr:hypothetical protein [Muribaculaceae bacterium]
MITQQVIKEIYKKYNKPPRNEEELSITHYMDLLRQNHELVREGGEIVNVRLDAFNPFKRMLIKSLHAILELDKVVAFVFPDHILFFEKSSENMHVHFKPERRSFLSRLFGRKE